MRQECKEYFLAEYTFVIDGIDWTFQLHVLAHFDTQDNRAMTILGARLSDIVEPEQIGQLGRYFLSVISHCRQRTVDCWAAIHGLSAQRPNTTAEAQLLCRCVWGIDPVLEPYTPS